MTQHNRVTKGLSLDVQEKRFTTFAGDEPFDVIAAKIMQPGLPVRSGN
jgi:hypothetical protein